MREKFELMGGCSSKLSGVALKELLESVFQIGSDRKLQDNLFFDRGQDSVRLSLDEVTSSSLFINTEISPPISTDENLSAHVAVLNALNDIWVSGGVPTHAMIQLILDINSEQKQWEIVLECLSNALAAENVRIVGGHTMLSPSPLLGITVFGGKRDGWPDESSLKDGDFIVISKQLTSFQLRNNLDLGKFLGGRREFDQNLLLKSNGQSAIELSSIRNFSATDVSGFGLLGHLSEMLPNGYGANLWRDSLHALIYDPDAVGFQLADASLPGYINSNFEYSKVLNKTHKNFTNLDKVISCLPQTNGPILATCSESDAVKLGAKGFRVIGNISLTDSIEVIGQNRSPF
ncbi:AIR synthase related protein [Hellea sp.]|nr:AIR synthase related protein [Hellea sp.]